MHPYAIYFCLLCIPEISQAHFCPSYRKINSQHLPQGWLIVQGGEVYHSAPVAQRKYLVVRLSVIRAEHNACKRKINMIAQADGIVLEP